MTYQNFIEEVRSYFYDLFTDGTTVSIHQVTKNNGLILDGLSIHEPNQSIAPTIYLNPYYTAYLEGTLSFSEIVNEIHSIHIEYLPKAPFRALDFEDYSKIKHSIRLKLINYQLNKELLKTIPHIPYLDLAICFYCLFENIDGVHGSILIQNDHISSWGISEHDLYELASKNTMENMKPHILTMSQFMEDWDPHFIPLSLPLTSDWIPSCSPPMYVLTNQHSFFGAATILYENLLKEISNSFSSSLIIIPSSIHEVILFPTSERETISEISTLVREVNRTQVSPDEILSDHAYFYDYNTHTLTMGEYHYELNL